jgi:hypothetical protein
LLNLPRPCRLPALRTIAHAGILAGAKTAIAQGVAKGTEAVTEGAKSVKEHMAGTNKPQTTGKKVGAKVDEAADAAAKLKTPAAEAIASGADKLKEQLGGKGDVPKESK